MIQNLIISFGFLVVSFPSCLAQTTCHSGQLDPRVVPIVKSVPNLSLEQERAIPIQLRRGQREQATDGVKFNVVNVTADSIPLTWFVPNENKSKRLLPVIIFYMGGGFIASGQTMARIISQDMANKFDALVFSVDYRVAPENKFPVPVMDCYHAFRWIASHAAAYGGDTTKIMLDGGSAGGNMAAAVCLQAKADGVGKKIKLLSLFCPALDFPDSTRYPSVKENAKGYLLSLNNAFCLLELYYGPGSNNSSDFRLFPMRAKSFSNLPPTLIFTAEFDIFRDQGQAYAKKLTEAGVPVFFKCFPGEIHTLIGVPQGSSQWTEMDDAKKEFMRKYL